VEAGAEDGTGTGEATSGQHVELLREPLRQAQRAGLPVTLETEPIGQIPPAAEHVLHRVAQESLTNVVRHAPGAATTVSLRTEMGRVALVVKNAPAPGAPTGDAVPASRNDDRSCLAGAGEQADAAPAGRHAGEPLNEGCSPTQGTDVSGPMALINSVSKLPNDKVAAGQLLNTRFTPMTFAGEEALDKFVSFLYASLEKGIYHNQFNVIDSTILRAAQKDPDKYRNLIVRVAGYCAQFVSLMPEAQEAIIARTELEL